MTEPNSFRRAQPYDDVELADYYSSLDYRGTFGLAVRDLPEIIARQATGSTALDFACGGGRSARFLKSLGFETVGVDISQAMLANAVERDPGGQYLLVGDADLSALSGRTFDLVHSAFPFCSTKTREKMRVILNELKNALAPEGCLIVVEPTDDFYRCEWLSFSTAAFAENMTAKSGDPVGAVFRDRMDQPVYDTLWTDEDYRQSFEAVGLRLLETHLPRARYDDPEPWVSERDIAPWVIYVLSRP